MYVPDTLVKVAPDRVEKIKKRFDADVLALEGKPKEQKEYITSRYKNRLEYFNSSIEDGEFIIGGDIEKYLTKLLQHVIAANPSINPKIQLFVSRSTVPNAYSTGDDNIIVNIGLLNKVKNDAEIVFVLCHELAHQVLEHNKVGLYAKAEKYTNKDFVKSLNRTLKEQYNVKQKLEDLIMPSLISDIRIARLLVLKTCAARAALWSAQKASGSRMKQLVRRKTKDDALAELLERWLQILTTRPK